MRETSAHLCQGVVCRSEILKACCGNGIGAGELFEDVLQIGVERDTWACKFASMSGLSSSLTVMAAFIIRRSWMGVSRSCPHFSRYSERRLSASAKASTG